MNEFQTKGEAYAWLPERFNFMREELTLEHFRSIAQNATLLTLQKHLDPENAANFEGPHNPKHANEFGFKKVYDQAKELLSSIQNCVLPYVVPYNKWESGWQCVPNAVHNLK